MPQNFNLAEAEHIKKFVDIPVVCAGRMEPEVGARAVAEGRIDGVGIARQFLADPEWITKLMAGDLESIRPCICCHNACFNMAHYKGVGNDQTLAGALQRGKQICNAGIRDVFPPALPVKVHAEMANGLFRLRGRQAVVFLKCIAQRRADELRQVVRILVDPKMGQGLGDCRCNPLLGIRHRAVQIK